MRADMAKVIVERPRIGSRSPTRKKGYRKYVQPRGWDNLPQREPMLGPWRGGNKWLNEHLGPMRRFLRSNVGRPWNHVHRELCEHVSFDNSVQVHVLAHIFDFVQQHVDLRGREVVSRVGWRRDRVLEPGEMYICPRTGLLKAVRRRRVQPRPRRLGLGKPLQFHYRDGVWWELFLHRLPDDRVVTRRHASRRFGSLFKGSWDAWLERSVCGSDEAELKAVYGAKFVAISKRPLTADEARVIVRKYARATKGKPRRPQSI